jgi:hypothetical protein
VQFSTTYTLPLGKAHMIDWITDKEYWQPALDQHGHDRTDARVINATDIIPLTDYPPGTKLFLRRTAAPRRATDPARYRRAPDHRHADQLAALARTVP